jgi:murein L,D-transpeptidase YafK
MRPRESPAVQKRPSGARVGLFARQRLLGFSLLLGFGVFPLLGFGAEKQSKPLELPADLRADAILIIKHTHTLYLLHDNLPMHSYPIALGLNPVGTKKHQGDFRTPEGRYVIDFRQEHSHFFKALHVSYPNVADAQQAASHHWPTGGDIFIHGLPNVLKKPLSYYQTRDWTNGCIALSNEDLRDIWDLTAGETPVQILP